MNFWNMLDESTRREFRSAAAVRKYRSGAVVINEGDRSGWVLVLTAGRVKIVSSAGGGGHDAVLGVREPGDIVGEMAAVDGNPRSASVVAVEDVSALWLPVSRFASLMREPVVWAALLKIISGRLRTASQRRAEFADTTTLKRVAALVLELVERYGVLQADGWHVALPMSQQDMGGLVGASREGVARALRVLRERGIVSTGRQKVVVHKLDELRRMVNA